MIVSQYFPAKGISYEFGPLGLVTNTTETFSLLKLAPTGDLEVIISGQKSVGDLAQTFSKLFISTNEPFNYSINPNLGVRLVVNENEGGSSYNPLSPLSGPQFKEFISNLYGNTLIQMELRDRKNLQ